VPNVDGHDAAAIEAAIQAAKADPRPSLVCCKTIIGWGSPNKAGTHGVHGAALGEAEVAATREKLGWTHAPFVVPDEIRRGWDARASGAAVEQAWQQRLAAYRAAHPELAAEYERRIRGELPADWRRQLQDFIATALEKPAAVATRISSQQVLNVLGAALPELLGGSADLTWSNNTDFKGYRTVTPQEVAGNYIHHGVREFGMCAVMNGVALHGGFVPYGGTFLVFSDYARNAVRMAALMQQRVVLVFTHDSIGLGEDGPTHQPVEHVASLRLIPNMRVWRPCDTVETAVAWGDSIDNATGPTSLILSRQALPPMPRTPGQVAAIARGGYVLIDSEGVPECVLIATGSEVGIAVEAAKLLAAQGRRVRVVSMPCTSLFDAQDAAYRASVLPAGTKRVAIEAGSRDGWWRYVGLDGAVVGMDTFGASAPAKKLFEHFGLTAANVAQVAAGLL
jgi:transketolase